MKKLEDYSPEKLYFAVNPFTVNFRIPVNERPTGKKVKLPDGTVKSEIYLAERTPYTRVFSTYDNARQVFALSNKALWLFTYIVFNIEQGKDYVQINLEVYKKRLNVSADNTFLEAKKELIAKGFIASTGIYKTVFWINPQIFFPGNRVTAFPTHLSINPFNDDTSNRTKERQPD